MKMNEVMVEFVENDVKEFIGGVKDVVKGVGVLMVRKEEVDGKVVKRMKMVELNESVKEYVELGSSGKVKENILNKVLESGVFGRCDEKDLWWRMDEFMDEWKKMRCIVVKKKMKLKKEWMIENGEVDEDVEDVEEYIEDKVVA